MKKLTRSELYFVGVIGTPYILSIMLLVSVLSRSSNWFYLLVIPAWYLFDLYSQSAYMNNVLTKRYSKFSYAIRSLSYQFVGIGIVFLVLKHV